MAPLRPGSAVAAVALAVVAAGLLLASVVLVLIGAVQAGAGSTDGAWGLATGVVLTCGLAAAGLLGAVSLYRGTGRTLLLATAWVESGLVAATAVWSGVLLAGDPGARPAVTTGVLLGALAALLLTGAQVRLGSARPVTRWLESTAQARASTGASSPADGRPVGLRAVLAVGVPVAVLAVVTAAVVLGGGGAGVTPGTGPGTPVSPTVETRSPVAPPAAEDGEWSAEFDPGARACFAGSMAACDDLYWESSVGGVYESYGSTCGGRLARGTGGGCVSALGATLN